MQSEQQHPKQQYYLQTQCLHSWLHKIYTMQSTPLMFIFTCTVGVTLLILFSSSPTADVLEENQVGRRKYDNTIIRNSEKPSRLIVMFYRYAPHRELAAAVVDYIHRHNQFQAEGCDWKVIDRNNPAVKFHPTDFVILEIRGCAEHHQHAIKHTLNKVAGIKYTGSDREVRILVQTTIKYKLYHICPKCSCPLSDLYLTV